jgi:hypothetical protein
MPIPLKLTSSGAYGQFSSTDVVPTNNGGMPLGGAAGQVPSKASINDHDWAWSDLPGAEITITPPLITSDELDYYPTDLDICSVVRVSCDDSMPAIKGFQYSGRSIRFRNIGDNPLVFVGKHPDNTPANWVNSGEDYILMPGAEVRFSYDTVDEFWYIANAPPSNDSPFIVYQRAFLGSVTAGDYSNVNLGVFAVGTTAVLSPAAGYPSGVTLRTHINTTLSGAAVWLVKTANAFWFFGSAQLEAQALVSIPVLSDATNRFSCGLQLRTTINGGTMYVSNTLSIDYDHGVVGGNWQLFSQTGGSTVSVNTNIAVVAGKLYDLKIIINKARTEARFYINGKMAGIIDTNLPGAVAAGARCVMLRNGAGTIVREFYVHQLTARAIFTLT